MNSRTLAALALLAATVSLPGPVRAAESMDNCEGYIDALPATVSTPGVWCLRKDLSTAQAAGAAITLAASDITLDCNGYKVGGLAAGASTDAVGVYANGHGNLAVRGCTVRGFRTGIKLNGRRTLVERNRLDANTEVGIRVEGDMTIVRGNMVNDTGGRPDAWTATAIMAPQQSHVIGNDIQGVQPTGTGNAYGIDLQRGIVRGNRVGGLLPGADGDAMGIRASQALIVRNTLIQRPAGEGMGISGELGGIVCRDNVVVGYAQPQIQCHDVVEGSP